MGIRKKENPSVVTKVPVKALLNVKSAMALVISSKRITRETQVHKAIILHKIPKERM